ncbi:phosphonate C-P lyase system protein PhnH [Nisaea denitrificans]|uniref:phosphonate C-P lyase system protein PhnH n=1 Tax=Nisaea denitrificans TaxID=390877 RepID=UPI000A05F4F8|nr:phosphonate C-P lyase system protein PhnH [Nisaea denitrificans]
MMSTNSTAQMLTPGFSDPVSQSQLVFRRLLDAMARPGSIETVDLDIEGPETLDLAATAITLALVDFETPLYLAPALATPAAETYLKFHCGTRIITDAKDAAFGILDGTPEDLSTFNTGTEEYPELGATLIIQIETIRTNGPLTLTGPGIKDSTELGLPDVPASFWDARTKLQRYFPRGIDLVFVSGAEMVALPRTTNVTLQSGKE